MNEVAVTTGRLGREYETIYLLRADVKREDAVRIAKRVEDVIRREGGQLVQVESWGYRQTAFPVAKFRRAVYVYLRYVGGGGVVAELERTLRMLDDVVKYQTTRLRDQVDLDALRVNPEEIQFELGEPPAEEEPEEPLARRLGLEDGAGEMRAERPGSALRDRAEAESQDEELDSEDEEAEEEEEEEGL